MWGKNWVLGFFLTDGERSKVGQDKKEDILWVKGTQKRSKSCQVPFTRQKSLQKVAQRKEKTAPHKKRLFNSFERPTVPFPYHSRHRNP